MRAFGRSRGLSDCPRPRIKLVQLARKARSAVKLVRMTVEKVSSTDAKNRLNALLAEVERTGKTLVITNHGRDVARLVPATPTPRQFGQMPNLSIPKDFDEPLPDTELARWEGDESS